MAVSLLASLLTASCAIDPPPSEPALNFSPAPVSTLLSRRDLAFKVAEIRHGRALLTVVAYQEPGAVPSRVAEIETTSTASGDETHISIRLLGSIATRPESSDVDIVTTELVYFLTVQLEPQAKFCLARGAQPCDLTSGSLTHPEVLRQLALAREKAVRNSGRSTMAQWQSVSMASGAVSGDHVSVRVSQRGIPLEGVSVYFNRAPHSGCGARTGSDGVAACDLVDQHGEDDDDRTGAVRVVATFPGDVRAGKVLVPTTFTLPDQTAR